MDAKAPIAAAATLALIFTLLTSPAHAEDKANEKPPPFHPSEREMTLARGFITLNAQAYPEAYEDRRVPKGATLDKIAENLLYVCTRFPIAQMPRGILQNCEDFDHFKEVFAQFPSTGAKQEEGAKAAAPPLVKEPVVPHNDPGAVFLCAPPHRMTRDGCQ